MSRLNTIIDANIKENGNQEITGKALNYVLNEIAKEVEQGGNVKADGVYPDLIAGDLAGRGESVPAEFTFRASGGKSIKDGRAYIKRIKGNSVVWNQGNDLAIYPSSVESNGITYTKEGNGFIANGTSTATSFSYNNLSLRLIIGHKYYIPSEVDTNYYAQVYDGTNAFTGIFVAVKETATYRLRVSAGVTLTNYRYSLPLYDLTKMFQAGNEPTTIEEFNARVATLGVDMNAYNEGQVIHCNTESIKSVGDNAWDEEWVLGRLNTDTGQPNPGGNGIHSKNYNKVLPNEAYYCGYNVTPIFAMFYDAEYNLIQQVSGSNHFINIRNRQFTTPANAVYMKFYVVDITTYNHDIMITLVHSGWKQDTDAGYQPYWQDILPLPIIRKYFPDGMKSAGSAHDEIRYNKASGTWEAVQRIGSVDLGTLSIISRTTTANGVEYRYFLTNDLKDIGVPPNYGEVGNAIVAPYTIVSALGLVNKELPNKSVMAYNDSGLQVYFRDDAYTDVATFKAAMQDVILYYELAEPIVTELDAEDQNFRDYYNVADFGTEQSQSSVPSAAFSADIIYQFNAVDMIRENYNEIERIKAALAKVGITLD